MKHYTAENYNPITSIGVALGRARNQIVSDMDAALRDLDINSQQMGIILSLGRGLANTPFELSKLLDIDTGLMTRMLDKLERQEMLQRERSLDDRRMVNLQLTRHGKQVAAEIPHRAPQVLNNRLKEFSAAEFQELQRLLAKFVGA